MKEKVNITAGEVFTRIYLPISYLHRILTQILHLYYPIDQQFTPERWRGEHKKQKTPDAYAREERREERKKTREELKESPQVLFWSGVIEIINQILFARKLLYLQRDYLNNFE